MFSKCMLINNILEFARKSGEATEDMAKYIQGRPGRDGRQIRPVRLQIFLEPGTQFP